MPKTYSERLIQVLNLVAAEANIQMPAFPDFVHIPDEIAVEVSDAIEYAPITRSDMDSAIINVLAEIDAVLNGFAGNKSFWTQECMRTDSTWEKLRVFARKELNKLGLSPSGPDLFWVTYSQRQPNAE